MMFRLLPIQNHTMIELRELLTGEGRTSTAFLPAVAIGYVAWKQPQLCTVNSGIVGWRYTGLPEIIYWIVATVALISGAVMFTLGYAGNDDEEGDGVPDKTKENPVINASVTLYGIFDLLMVPFLLLRVCSGNRLILILLAVFVALWITMFAQRALIDRVQDRDM